MYFHPYLISQDSIPTSDPLLLLCQIVRAQLEPTWRTASRRAKALVSDLHTLRKLLGYVTRYDAVTFFAYLEARDYHILIHHNIIIIIPSFSTPGRIFGGRYAPGTFRACVDPSPLGTAALAPRLIRTGAFQIHNNSSTCMAADVHRGHNNNRCSSRRRQGCTHCTGLSASL